MHVIPECRTLHFRLIELCEILVGLFLQPVKVPLNGGTSLWCISQYSQFFIICKLAEGALSPIIQVINGDVKQCGPQYRPLERTTSDWSPIRVHASCCKCLIPTAQPIFSPLCCLLTQSGLHQFVYGMLWESVESLAKFKVNIYCFPINAIECCERDIFKVLSRV